ncbi:rhomboid family intramembrane serine protease GlpG [Colwellia sp. MEBiC06753]
MNELHLEPLVKVDQRSIAELFVQYLKSLTINADVLQDTSGIWIRVEQSKLHQAAELFNEFALQPYHPKYQQAAWQNAEVSQALPTSAFGDLFSQFFKQAGAFTLIVFAICWLVYLGAQFGFARALYLPLAFFQQLSVEQLLTEPWRLIGPAFLHFSLLHIAFNTMWWWQLGSAIEKLFGRAVIINLFLLSAIVSNLGQFLVSGPNFGGLSGVVYAVVGFAWWSGWLMPEKGLQLSKPIVGFLLIWLALGYVDVLPINMANTAHLMGLVVGCLMALVIAKRVK